MQTAPNSADEDPADHEPDDSFLGGPVLGAAFSVARLVEAAAADPAPVIDGYQLLEEVVSGVSGSVYRARELGQAGRQVAIKLLSTEAIGQSALRRLHQEIQSLAALEHPSIARLLGEGAARDGRAYCVLEWVEGVPLRIAGRDPGFTLRQRVAVMHELAEALAHAHAKGVLHRDLSPANVIVRPEGAPRCMSLIDFGLARVAGQAIEAGRAADRTREGAPMGTPGYMSPEQLAGAWSKVDARSEVFAAGVMLHELLTGQLPWPVRDVPFAQAYATMRASRPPSLARPAKGVGPDLAAIAGKAIELDQADRYQSMSEFAGDLRRWLEGLAVSARVPTLREAAWRSARRHPVPAALVLLLVLALAVSTGLSWSLARGLEREHTLLQTQALLNLDAAIKLADRSGVQPQRREFLQQANALSAQLLVATPTSRAVLRIRAGVLTEISKLARDEAPGGIERARALRLEALGIRDQLLAAASGDPPADDLRAHALALVLCGDTDKEAGQLEAARGWYERALREHRVLALRDPTDLPSARQVIFGIERLADLHERQGLDEVAERLYREQLAEAQALCAAHPERVHLLWDRCAARSHMIVLCTKAGDLDGACAMTDDLCADSAALIALDPESRAYRSLDARSRISKGRALRLRGDVAGAAPWINAGVAMLEMIVAADPGPVDERNMLRAGLLELVELHEAQGDHVHACAERARADAIGESTRQVPR